MNILQAFTFAILLIGSSFITVSANDCNDTKKGRCTIKINELRPTQYSLGMLSIKSKTQEVELAYSNGKLSEFLKSKVAPAIIGPDQNYYITDRHHTSFSITKALIPEELKTLEIEVLHDWSKLSFKDFEIQMIQNNYVWLIDETHTRRDIKNLPTNISNLTDDPYRSLAWKVRKAGGFDKVEVSYLEFYWGMFFKSNGIILSSSYPEDIDEVLEQAMSLARSNKASHLPGFKKN